MYMHTLYIHVQVYHTFRLTSMTSSNAFSVILSRDLSLVIPAAFTTTLSGGPPGIYNR